MFVIDAEDLEKIIDQNDSWYEVNGYIGYTEMINRKVTQYYLHNAIMDKPVGGGKGQKYTFDHISRIKTDNRKVNLRLATQTMQNENRVCAERNCDLPKDCGININDIPKCVYYSKPRDKHGARFILELHTDGKRLMWSSTSSKEVSLKDKLIEIKKIILDINENTPEVLENKNIIENFTDQQIKLMKDYNCILKLSEYDCVDQCLLKIPKKKFYQ